MPRKQLPKFVGPLAAPIYEPPGGLLTKQDGLIKRVLDRQFEKMLLLLDHFEIDRQSDSCWFILSLKLARDYVPGMQVLSSPPPKPGRRRTWQAGLGEDLLHAVEERQSTHPSTLREALQYLRRTEEKWKRYPFQTLAARYREARTLRRKRRDDMQKLFGEHGYMSLSELGKRFPLSAGLGLLDSHRGATGDASDEKVGT
jgi:hypothetical protein